MDVYRRVQHFKHPVKRHERRHQIHPCVGESSERGVDASHQKAHRSQRAYGYSAVDHHQSAIPVDQRSAERAHQREGDEKSLRHQGSAHAVVAHFCRLLGKLVSFSAVASEKLHQQRPRHIHALGHRVVHGGVVFHLIADYSLQSPPHPTCGDDEKRQDEECHQGETPLQQQHREERQNQQYPVAGNLAERGSECPLRTDHIVVHAADERAGLRASEEQNGLALHMVVKRHSQVENETFADACRPEPFQICR